MNKTKILWKTLTPVAVFMPVIASCVSCNNNVYAKNKDDLLRLIDGCKNETKAMLWKLQSKIFNKNIDSPFDNLSTSKYVYDKYQGYYWKIEKYKASEILDKEKWDLIFHSFFKNIKEEIFKLDIDHKQQYEKILLLKHKILNLKGEILTKLDNWILGIK